MKLTPRAYQLAIYNSILENGNTLVVLPTGLGKTLIALMLIKDKIKKGRCLFLTPTKPLAKQHLDSTNKILEIEDAVLVTGETSANKRKKEYDNNVIVSTPQTVRNDLQAGRVTSDFSLCIFDEAHRAIGDYAYTYIAEKLYPKTLFVGLTASPGGKRERINEVMENLHIQNIEIRGKNDKDVKPYVQQSEVTWIPLTLSPTLKLMKKLLDDMISKHARILGAMGFPPPLKHKGLFLQMREKILGIEHGMKYRALVHYSILLHLLHMVELLETQGIHPLRNYIKKLHEKETKSSKMLLNDASVKKVEKLCETEVEHPKLGVLVKLMKKLDGKKSIVFAQYRDQVKKIEDELQKNGFTAKHFVGKKDGYTRKMQEATIADFREGKFDILVSSSIAEEGLDIPAVDAVVFYEPIPSEIRSIQRRGRAARFKKGEIYILMTKGTRDEYYYWSSLKKEKKMKTIMDSMKRKLSGEKRKSKLEGQTKISSFFE